MDSERLWVIGYGVREAMAGGADAQRRHGLRGERSNVPREARLFT